MHGLKYAFLLAGLMACDLLLHTATPANARSAREISARQDLVNSKPIKRRHTKGMRRRNVAGQRSEEAFRVLQNYLNCSRPLASDADFENLRQCVNAQIFARASALRRDRFVSWLLLAAQIEEIFYCDEQDLGAAEFFPEKTPLQVCFRFTLNERTQRAVAFFKKEGLGQLGLYSIFY